MSDFNFNLDDLFNDAVQTPKAKISIDPSPLSTESVAVNASMLEFSALMDTAVLTAEIAALDAETARRFRRFVLEFKPERLLPKGSAKAYHEFSDEMRVCWLWMRFKCQSSLMFLAGHVDLRELTDEELDKCIRFVISCTPPITDVLEIPVSLLGFELNSTMRVQVEWVLANSPKLFRLFPERLKWWVEIA